MKIVDISLFPGLVVEKGQVIPQGLLRAILLSEILSEILSEETSRPPAMLCFFSSSIALLEESLGDIRKRLKDSWIELWINIL